MYQYKKKSNGLMKFVLLNMLIIGVAVISIFLYNMYLNIDIYSNNQLNGETTQVSFIGNTNVDTDDDIVQIVENIMPSVVGISKIKNTGSAIFLNDSTSDLGLGTGMIVSEDGYILTNWHIVGDKYSNCYVTLESGNTVNGSVEWADETLDLAIVKISATNLKCVNLGDSDNIKIGEKSYAIGNPVGVDFQRTVTSGIISGVNRTVKVDDEDGNSYYVEDLIQTDATISDENSGGPLINFNGEVIGINSSKIIETNGVNFSIPINIVKPIVESFIQNGEFEEAYLGIFVYDKSVVSYLNSSIELNSGMYIAEIAEDGPISSLDIMSGDIISKIDDITITKMSELRIYIYTKKIGDEVNLTILRDNREYNIKVTLGKKS